MKGLKQLLECDPADLKAWRTYPHYECDPTDPTDAPFEILIDCATGDDQRAFLAKHKRGEIAPDEWRDYWCGKVLDWRGPVDDGQPLKCTPQLTALLWARDPHFGPWLVSEAQKFTSFRK